MTGEARGIEGDKGFKPTHNILVCLFVLLSLFSGIRRIYWSLNNEVLPELSKYYLFGKS